jgi:hypothetical protein
MIIAAEQIFNHFQFGGGTCIALVQLQRAVIRLASHFCIDVPQVFMGGCIAWMSAYCHFQFDFGFFILALPGIQYSDVVIWLGQVRIVLSESGENLNCFGSFALLGKYQPFEKACLSIFGLASQYRIQFFQSLCLLTLLEQLVSILNFISCSQIETQQQRNERDTLAELFDHMHRNIFPENGYKFVSRRYSPSEGDEFYQRSAYLSQVIILRKQSKPNKSAF